MIDMVNRLDDYDGFSLVKEVKKNGVKIYVLKEPGQRFITIKLSVDRIEIPLFNLISLLYETELYDLWFPFCKKSKDVRNLSVFNIIIAQEIRDSNESLLLGTVFPFSFEKQRKYCLWFRSQ
jgi:hypothetical protein